MTLSEPFIDLVYLLISAIGDGLVLLAALLILLAFVAGLFIALQVVVK